VVDAAQRHELAQFLRSRRARRSPEDAALAVYGRRRVPGLRREEVATLAGVSATWYTWLEQARDIHVSEQILVRSPVRSAWTPRNAPTSTY
jgi:transcriptional regulator with XRE-family HTH domain